MAGPYGEYLKFGDRSSSPLLTVKFWYIERLFEGCKIFLYLKQLESAWAVNDWPQSISLGVKIRFKSVVKQRRQASNTVVPSPCIFYKKKKKKNHTGLCKSPPPENQSWCTSSYPCTNTLISAPRGIEFFFFKRLALTSGFVLTLFWLFLSLVDWMYLHYFFTLNNVYQRPKPQV